MSVATSYIYTCKVDLWAEEMLELADILPSNCLKLCVCVGVAVTFKKAWEFEKGCGFCFFWGEFVGFF